MYVHTHLASNTTELSMIAMAPLKLKPSGLSIWKVSSPTKQANFNKISKKKLHITTWSDFTKKSSQDLYSVCHDGFTFEGNEGQVATNGLVIFDGQHKLGDNCIVIMVDTIVGLSKVVDESKKYNINHLPPGYDSLSLQKYGGGGDPNESAESDLFSDTSSVGDVAHNSSSKEFLHRYQVFNEYQLFPKYVMRFSLASEDERGDSAKDIDVYDRKDFFDLEEWRAVTLRDKVRTKRSEEGASSYRLTQPPLYQLDTDASILPGACEPKRCEPSRRDGGLQADHQRVEDAGPQGRERTEID